MKIPTFGHAFGCHRRPESAIKILAGTDQELAFG
jgi:hypothetical protein